MKNHNNLAEIISYDDKNLPVHLSNFYAYTVDRDRKLVINANLMLNPDLFSSARVFLATVMYDEKKRVIHHFKDELEHQLTPENAIMLYSYLYEGFSLEEVSFIEIFPVCFYKEPHKR